MLWLASLIFNFIFLINLSYFCIDFDMEECFFVLNLCQITKEIKSTMIQCCEKDMKTSKGAEYL